MIGIYVFTVIALVSAGVMIGVLAVLSLGIRRDDHPGGFPADTEDRVVRSVRRLIGVGTRAPEPAKRSEALRPAISAPRAVVIAAQQVSTVAPPQSS